MKPLSEYLIEENNKQSYNDAIRKIQKKYPVVKKAGGIEFCAFVSGKLKKEIPELEIIIGYGLVDKPLTDELWAHANVNMLKIKKDDIRYDDAVYFLSHNKHKKDIGHCVCYDGSTIIDPTSSQFGLPIYYSLEEFESYFTKIKRNQSIEIRDISDYGII